MNFRRFVLALSILLLAGTWETRAEKDGEQALPPIRRLFGVELGTRVTDYEAVGEAVVEAPSGFAPQWIQKIAPPEPNTLFDGYQVIYNPQTKEIYQISGQSTLPRAECHAMIPILADVIKKQYEGYKIIQKEDFIVIDRRDSGDMIFPYQIQCTSDKLRILVFDEKAHHEHVKQNKNRSPISPSGL
ncbi:hypothetical protein [Rhizobium giardinii]|uniref:hypothetical protein n=1 Tax=Rhizobium giardinii TaxID=56731 RepID=UPI003D6FDA88